jgi:hypothetical protein
VKQVQFKEEQLPESMMVAIRIIERLLTQSKYHDQHVQYKNYPAVDKSMIKHHDDDEEEGKKFTRGIKMKQEKKEEEEEKKVEEELKDGEVVLKPLFTFECDLIQGR